METDTLRALVQTFIDTLRVGNALPISAPFVASRISEDLPHAAIFSTAEREAVYVGAATVAREILRGAHDREYNAARIGQEDLDLPEASLLNKEYSVMRADEPVYIPRHLMTREDMEFVCNKFDKLSGHFARASRALRADFERRAGNVTATA